MSGSQIAKIDLDSTTTHSTTSKSLDRCVARFEIKPAHRAITAIYPCSKSGKEQILKNLVISEYYGVKPSFMHDSFRQHSYAIGSIRHHVVCLGNIRVYVNEPYNPPPEKTCYYYECIVDKNWLYITNITLITGKLEWNKPHGEPKFNLPKVKKGNYSIADSYKELLKVMNERREVH